MHIPELKKLSVDDKNDLPYLLVLSYIESAMAPGDYLTADRGQNRNYGPSAYEQFWYSHLCEGGGYEHVFTLYFPQVYDREEGLWVKVITSRINADSGNWDRPTHKFDLRSPDQTPLKNYFRECMDFVKKKQNRKPWNPFGD